MNRDFVCGLLMLALAAGYYALAADIPVSQLADDVGADGLPRVYAIALGLLGLVLTLGNLPRRVTAGAAASGERDLFQLRRAAGVLAISVGYVLVAPFAGYVPAIALVIVALAAYQGASLDAKLLLTALAGAVFLWFVFVYLLHIRQPAGLWPAVWS